MGRVGGGAASHEVLSGRCTPLLTSTQHPTHGEGTHTTSQGFLVPQYLNATFNNRQVSFRLPAATLRTTEHIAGQHLGASPPQRDPQNASVSPGVMPCHNGSLMDHIIRHSSEVHYSLRTMPRYSGPHYAPKIPPMHSRSHRTPYLRRAHHNIKNLRSLSDHTNAFLSHIKP